MNPDKAIEVLQDLKTTLPQSSPEERREAVILGIEALDFNLELRKLPGRKDSFRLPSETED